MLGDFVSGRFGLVTDREIVPYSLQLAIVKRHGLKPSFSLHIEVRALTTNSPSVILSVDEGQEVFMAIFVPHILGQLPPLA
jgi:hypothetical protein